MKLVILETIYPDWGTPYDSPTFVEYSSVEDLRRDVIKDIEENENESITYQRKWNIWNQKNQSRKDKIRSSSANIDRIEKALANLNQIHSEKRPVHFDKIKESMEGKINKEIDNIERLEKMDIGIEPEEPAKRKFNLFLHGASKIITLDEWFEQKKIAP